MASANPNCVPEQHALYKAVCAQCVACNAVPTQPDVDAAAQALAALAVKDDNVAVQLSGAHVASGQ